MNNIVSLVNISKIYDQKKILYDVNLTIDRGEIITIIGPNGSGKTTLAKILLKLIKPSSGKITIKKDITISYMPQKLAINQQLPINILRFLQLTDVNIEKITEIAKELEINQILSRQMNELSGGEMQRVLLARSLLFDPDLLVLDEPMQGVDLNGQIWFYKLLAKFKNQRKISILMISHDLHMVMRATDKVLCLNHHICCFGTPKDLITNPIYLNNFAKESLETMALYSHHHDHKH